MWRLLSAALGSALVANCFEENFLENPEVALKNAWEWQQRQWAQWSQPQTRIVNGFTVTDRHEAAFYSSRKIYC